MTRSSLALVLVLSIAAPSVLAQEPGEIISSPPVEADEPEGPRVLLPGVIAPPEEVIEAPVETPSTLSTEAAQGPRSDAETVLSQGIVASADAIGWRSPQKSQLPETLWRGTAAVTLGKVMDRIRPPRASRAAHRLLLRTLSTRAAVSGPGIAEMAGAQIHLLMRMGEASSAKAVADRVPQALYTRRLYAASGLAQLAAMDIPSLCPLVTSAVTFSRDSLWTLTQGVCFALKGDEAGAAVAIDIARKSDKVHPFDVELTDRVVNAISGGVRGGGLDWDPTARLTDFRLAMLAISGTPPPQTQVLRASVPMQAWIARNPAMPVHIRTAAARTAAGIGTMTPSDYVGLWSALYDGIDPRLAMKSRQNLLRDAHAARTYDARLAAMRQLWGTAKIHTDRVAMSVLTAQAAGQFPRTQRYASAAPEVVRGLVLAGEHGKAFRWLAPLSKAAADGDDAASEALIRLWPLLMLSDPRAQTRHQPRLFNRWWSAIEDDSSVEDEKRLGQLAAAAVSGLTGASMEEADSDVRPASIETPYGKRIAAAARAGQTGLVVLLATAAVGPSPKSVKPDDLRALCAALTQVGLKRDAAAIAADVLIHNGA
jgi:hypothetical protein